MRQGDLFLVHSKQDEADLLSICPDALYTRTVLPTFNSFHFEDLSKENARERINLSQDTRVLLFFGFVREYKGLKYLIQALPDIVKHLSDVKLLIVGDFSEDKADYIQLIEDNQMSNYIDIYDGYIPDKEVEKFFVASDLVVLPYVTATQSAVVQTAYSFDRPVIATNVGGLPEVVIHDKTGYLVEPKNSKELSQYIIRYFQENKAAAFREGSKSEAYKYSWARMVEVIEDLVRR